MDINISLDPPPNDSHSLVIPPPISYKHDTLFLFRVVRVISTTTMTKALIKGELDKEFRNLSRTGNYKTTSKDKTKSLTEFLPTNCHGVKKALKRLKSDKNRSNTLKSVKNKKQKKAGK